MQPYYYAFAKLFITKIFIFLFFLYVFAMALPYMQVRMVSLYRPQDFLCVQRRQYIFLSVLNSYSHTLLVIPVIAICFVVNPALKDIMVYIYNCVFGSLISDVTCNYVSADGGRDGLWWPALPGHWLSYTGCWLSLLVMYWLLCFGCCFYF